MKSNFKITLSENKDFYKRPSVDYIIYNISFVTSGGKDESPLLSSCLDNEIAELIKAIDDYLEGKAKDELELVFNGQTDCREYCRFAFKIIPQIRKWIFTYDLQGEQSRSVVYELCDEELRSLSSQLTEQRSELLRLPLGRAELYSIELPPCELEWCYSRDELAKRLNGACRDEHIRAIYVSARNYTEPLCVAEDYVNFYLDNQVFIQLDSSLIALFVSAQGLVKWRVFDAHEVAVVGPRVDFIRDEHRDYFDIKDAYGIVKGEYRGARIKQVLVEKTDSYPFVPEGFDESRADNSSELPSEIALELEGFGKIALVGADDDFLIKFKEQ